MSDPIFSSHSINTILALLDTKLTITFAKTKNGKYKLQGYVSGNLSVLHYYSSIWGGLLKQSTKGNKIRVSTETLYEIAHAYKEYPCQNQNIYQSIYEYQQIKKSYDYSREDETEYKHKYNDDLAKVTEKIKKYYVSRPIHLVNVSPIYLSGLIECSDWARFAKNNRFTTIMFRIGGYWKNILNPILKANSFNGQKFIELYKSLSPFVYRKSEFDLMIDLLNQRNQLSYEEIRKQSKEFIDQRNSFYSFTHSKTQLEIDQEVEAKREIKKQIEINAKNKKEEAKSVLKKLAFAEQMRLVQEKKNKLKEIRAARKKILNKQNEEKKELNRVEKARVQSLFNSGLIECGKCSNSLPLENFYTNIRRPNGYAPYCKSCNKKYLELDETKTLYRERMTRTKELRKITRNKYKDKIKNSPQHKIRRNINRRIKDCIRKRFKKETYKTLVACSPKYLVSYLESKFLPGMTWENYGSWHIDHIIPCAAFDFTNKNHVNWCNHYKNLQPLWAKDNEAKTDQLKNGKSVRELSPKNIGDYVGTELELAGITTKEEYNKSLIDNTKVIYLNLN